MERNRSRSAKLLCLAIVLSPLSGCPPPSGGSDPPPAQTWDYVIQSAPENGGLTLDHTPTLTWSIDATAVGYQFRTSGSAVGLSSAAVVDTVSATHNYVASIAFSTVEYWQVRVDEGSGFGSWSPAYHFTVSQSVPISLVSPVGGATTATTSPLLDWDPVQGAWQYYLDIFLQSDLAAPLIQAEALDNVDLDLAANSVTLAAATGYAWRVMAKNTDGDGSDWSALAYFSTP